MSDKIFTPGVIIAGVMKGVVWFMGLVTVLFFMSHCIAFVSANEPQAISIDKINDPTLDQAIIFGVGTTKERETIIIVPYAQSATFNTHEYMLLLRDHIDRRMAEYPEHAHYYLEAQERVQEALNDD